MTADCRLSPIAAAARSLRKESILSSHLNPYFFSLFHPRTAPAGASTLRPLARRALSTLRPDALAMRVRNPLVRARLRRVPLSVHPMDLPPATITNAPRPAFFVAAFVFANALDASATRVGAARTRVANARWRCCCCCCCCDDDDAVVVADVSAEATADMQNADIVVCVVLSRVVVVVVDTHPSIHPSIGVASIGVETTI